MLATVEAGLESGSDELFAAGVELQLARHSVVTQALRGLASPRLLAV